MGDFSFQEGDFHWCRRPGCRRIPNRFDMMKIREKSVEIWAKSLKNINICQSVYIMQQEEFWTFLVYYALVSSIVLILVENDQ